MDNRDFKPLQKKAYDHIRQQILDGNYAYHQIYSESKIAAEIGISRTPVRDAVHCLYQEGLIDIMPNKGFVLHIMTPQDIMETYDVRSALEGFCARKAALAVGTKEQKALLKDLKASHKKLTRLCEKQAKTAAFIEEDQHFHQLLIAFADNRTFTDSFEHYMYRIGQLASCALELENRKTATLQEHQAIIDAIEQGDAQKAYDATIAHIMAVDPLSYKMEI